MSIDQAQTATLNIRDLSFIQNGAWAPDRPQGYSEGCATGRGYADELQEAMTATGNPALFGGVMRLIVTAGRFEAVEIGFCHRFGAGLPAV